MRTARALLDAGASANTGWFETIDYPNPRQIVESAIYGAGGVARHPELTRLLLEYGADPNDEETPYHAPEGYDNTVLQILLESGRLNQVSLSWMLARKADWHDEHGLRMVLEHGADPNLMTRFGNTALHHALQRDNSLSAIRLLLDYGADASLKDGRDGRSAVALAARRGRADVLTLFQERGVAMEASGADKLIIACATGDRDAVGSVAAHEPEIAAEVIAEGGKLLAEFAGNGNVQGVGLLLDLGVPVDALFSAGDTYWEIAKNSTALHVAAWRAQHAAVMELIERGAPVNAVDERGRTPLMLAVKACVDSYWKSRRSPDSVKALLRAGARVNGIEIPSGYAEADALLRQYGP